MIGYRDNASPEALRERLDDEDTYSLVPEMMDALYQGKAIPIIQSRGMVRMNLADSFTALRQVSCCEITNNGELLQRERQTRRRMAS